jgi:8-oxo-dGTP pyrophosphatase MutT (NUDIX family)
MSDTNPKPTSSVPELTSTSSTIVYRNRWMTVREDATVRPDGSTGIFGVVEKPDFALVIPFENSGFHMVEQFRYPVQGRYWEFPQGTWEDAPDADPLTLAAGELREETGLRAGSLEHLGYLYEAYGYCDQGFHVILATDLTQGKRNLDPEEVGLDSRWFSEEALWGLVAEGRLRDAPSLAALALFDRWRRGTGP